ncbi:MAG: RsmD family RNA methyltransferase [Thermoguttaceae bacterium]
MTKQKRGSNRRNSFDKRQIRGNKIHKPIGLRIVGGRFRGRKLLYGGDLRTRPMKNRLREAIFNLIADDVRDALVIDLFAGTGALGLEALSRGAAKAILLEQHYPTAEIIRQNVSTLGVGDQAEIVTGNVFIWARRQLRLDPVRLLVFCSPPYDFYVSRRGEMLELLNTLIDVAPPESVVVVEADDRFDFDLLPDAHAWNVRTYAPAIIGIYRKAEG